MRCFVIFLPLVFGQCTTYDNMYMLHFDLNTSMNSETQNAVKETISHAFSLNTINNATRCPTDAVLHQEGATSFVPLSQLSCVNYVTCSQPFADSTRRKLQLANTNILSCSRLLNYSCSAAQTLLERYGCENPSLCSGCCGLTSSPPPSSPTEEEERTWISVTISTILIGLFICIATCIMPRIALFQKRVQTQPGKPQHESRDSIKRHRNRV